MAAGFIQKFRASRKKQLLLLVLVLLVVNTLLYLQTVNYSFIKDDYRLVVENHRIKSFSSFVQSLDDKFFAFPDFAFLHYWRPMVILSFLGDHLVWQLNPAGYHLTNILLNTATVVLLFFLFYLLCKEVTVAFLVSLFYSLHPAKVEAVAWISGRPDLLSGAAIVAGLLCFVLYLKEVGPKKLLLTAIFLLFACALLAKENAVVFPLLIGGFVYLQPAFYEFAGKKRKIRQTIIVVIVLIIILSAYLVVHHQFTGSADLASSLSIKHLPAIAKTVGVYVKMILAPFYPSPHFPMSQYDGSSLMLIGYFLIGMALLVFVFINRDHYPLTLFSLLFLAMLVPVLNPHLLPTYPKIALRFIYLPAVVAGAFFMETVFVFKNKLLKKVYLILLSSVAAIWLIQVIQFQSFYQDHQTHYKKMVATHPDDCSLLLPWALIKARAGGLGQALRVVDRALLLDKEDRWIDISESGSLLKANLLVATGSLDSGKQLADSIIAKATDKGVKYSGWLIVAKYHEKKSDFGGALAALAKAGKLGETGDLFFRMALIYDKLADFTGADKAIDKALRFNPENHTFIQFKAYLKGKYPPYPLKR